MKNLRAFNPNNLYSTILGIGLGCILLWTIFASYLFISTNEKIVYVAIPDSGPSYILNGEPLENKKIDAKYFFAKFFLFNYTNFDKTTFDRTIGQTRFWMTEDLWGRLKDQYIDLKEKADVLDLTQVAKITSVDEPTKNLFTATAESKVLVRGKVKKYKGEFTMEIKPAPFVRGFNENGFEVLRLEEKWDEI